MDPRIQCVDDILGFRFVNGFADAFEQVGAPMDDLETWYRNAKVFKTVTAERTPAEESRSPWPFSSKRYASRRGVARLLQQ